MADARQARAKAAAAAEVAAAAHKLVAARRADFDRARAEVAAEGDTVTRLRDGAATALDGAAAVGRKLEAAVGAAAGKMVRWC